MSAKSNPFARFAALTAFGPKALERLDAGQCPTCGSTDQTFKDEKSRSEHAITGLCQKCQDDIFSP